MCVILFTGEGGLHPGGQTPALSDTLNQWAVHILLECVLVKKGLSHSGSLVDRGRGRHHARALVPLGSFFFHYRPQRSCGQGNIFTPVCHSVHGGGVSASVHAGIPPPRADTPREQTPPPGSRHTPPEQTPPRSRHPQSRHPWSRHPHPRSRPLPEQTPPPRECILVFMLFLEKK